MVLVVFCLFVPVCFLKIKKAMQWCLQNYFLWPTTNNTHNPTQLSSIILLGLLEYQLFCSAHMLPLICRLLHFLVIAKCSKSAYLSYWNPLSSLPSASTQPAITLQMLRKTGVQSRQARATSTEHMDVGAWDVVWCLQCAICRGATLEWSPHFWHCSCTDRAVPDRWAKTGMWHCLGKLLQLPMGSLALLGGKAGVKLKGGVNLHFRLTLRYITLPGKALWEINLYLE